MSKFSGLLVGKLTYVDSTIGGFGSLFLSRLSYKSAGITFLIISFVFYETVFPKLSFAFSPSLQGVDLVSPMELKTNSLFTEKTTVKTQELKFSHKTVIDPTLSPGERKIIQAGSLGKKIIQTKVVLHQGEEFSRENTLIKQENPINEVVAVGVDPDEKTLDTPYGTIKYKTKLNVWATSYDATCPGCNQTTAIGLKAGFGVIAVDPKIIPLRSKVYVPGYGVAVAGDTGGSVKGNRIDLGFDSLQSGWWTSRFTDIYLISS